ncbi:hypothetical protein DEO72_LG11g1580 [Vigna unguiculata]|uniref:Uncharacterized protein n=1 Tax=Vigna unguiculata TaxID=3917 RepID=A0A4D6NS21_VIGUN|nr:hypothetical protein DEO72_LG11g1580 [Vigna unguiculata]
MVYRLAIRNEPPGDSEDPEASLHVRCLAVEEVPSSGRLQRKRFYCNNIGVSYWTCVIYKVLVMLQRLAHMIMEKEESPNREMVEKVMKTLAAIKVCVTLAEKRTRHDV